MYNKVTGLKELINKYDTFIFDMDGVLWHASKKIDHAFEALHFLK